MYVVQRISQGESASDLLLVVDHVTNEVCHEGGKPFDGGDLCVTDGVGEIPMSPVDPLSPSVNPLSPGLHDAVDSEIHEGIGQLGYTGTCWCVDTAISRQYECTRINVVA